MKKLVILATFMAMTFTVAAQSGCYKTVRQAGLDSLEKNKYLSAMEKFDLAFECPDCPSNNDLRRWQEECRKSIKILIDQLNSDRDEKIRDLLLNQMDLGVKEIQLNNFYSAAKIFEDTYELATINDTVRMISGNMLKSWYASLTLPWLAIPLNDYDLNYESTENYDYEYSQYSLPVESHKNTSLPLLILPDKITGISENGELVTRILEPGISGDKVIFNREANVIIEVFKPNMLAIRKNVSSLPEFEKITFNDTINQVFLDNKGKYLALSFLNKPEIDIYSLPERSVIASYKPRKAARKKKDKTPNDDNLYRQNKYDDYAQANYSGENDQMEEPMDFMVVGNKLFHLYPDGGYIETLNLGTKKRKLLDYEIKIGKMASSPDEQFLILSGKDGVLLYSVLTGLHYPIQSYGVIEELCRVSPDSRYIAAATRNNYIDLYSIENGVPYFVSSNPYAGTITDFNFNRDSDKIVALINNQVMQVHALPWWTNLSGSIKTGSYGEYINYTGMVGNFVYGLSEDACKFLKLPGISPLKEKNSQIAAEEYVIPRLISTVTEENVIAIKAMYGIVNKFKESGAVFKAGLSPDGKYVALATLGKDFHVFNTRTGALVRKYAVNDYVSYFSFLSDDKIAICSENGLLYFFNLNKNEPIKNIDYQGINITDCHPSQMGKYLSLFLEDGTVIIYSSSSLAESFRYQSPPGFYGSQSVASKGWFSANDEYFALAGIDGKFRRWSTQNGKLVDSLEYYGQFKAGYWENDATLITGDDYGSIYQVDTIGGADHALIAYAEYSPVHMTSFPGTSMVILSSANGYLSFYDKVNWYRLGLPFMFSGVPEVISYDTLNGDCLVYARGDGFYKLHPFINKIKEIEEIDRLCFNEWSDYIFDTVSLISSYKNGRMFEKVGFPAGIVSRTDSSNLVGQWDCLSSDQYGTETKFKIHLESKYGNVYQGKFKIFTEYYNYDNDTTEVYMDEQLAEGRYEGGTGIVTFRFTDPYSYYASVTFRAYVSEDGQALIHGIIDYSEAGIENYSNPGSGYEQIRDKWSAKKINNSP